MRRAGLENEMRKRERKKCEREFRKPKKQNDTMVFCVFSQIHFHFHRNSYFIWHFIESVLHSKLVTLLLRFSFILSIYISCHTPPDKFIPQLVKMMRRWNLSTLDGDDSMWFLHTHSSLLHITCVNPYIYCDGIIWLQRLGSHCECIIIFENVMCDVCVCVYFLSSFSLFFGWFF